MEVVVVVGHGLGICVIIAFLLSTHSKRVYVESGFPESGFLLVILSVLNRVKLGHRKHGGSFLDALGFEGFEIFLGRSSCGSRGICILFSSLSLGLRCILGFLPLLTITLLILRIFHFNPLRLPLLPHMIPITPFASVVGKFVTIPGLVFDPFLPIPHLFFLLQHLADGFS